MSCFPLGQCVIRSLNLIWILIHHSSFSSTYRFSWPLTFFYLELGKSNLYAGNGPRVDETWYLSTSWVRYMNLSKQQSKYSYVVGTVKILKDSVQVMNFSSITFTASSSVIRFFEILYSLIATLDTWGYLNCLIQGSLAPEISHTLIYIRKIPALDFVVYSYHRCLSSTIQIAWVRQK